MKAKNILFRADSSSIIGTGHIMRDLVLAQQFKDANILFASQDLPGNINNKIREKKYSIEILNTNNIEEVISIIKSHAIEMIVIDHYGIDEEYEKTLKEITGITIFVLDDTYEKHECDILLNHNISANKEKYKDLVPSHCELRCGSKYTLLREEFYETTKKRQRQKKKKKKKKNIFLGLGGTDPLNLTSKVIKLLRLNNNLSVSIVSTNANPNLKRLKRLVFINKNKIKLYINCNDISALMNDSDLAIVTPSVIVHEVMKLKIPLIAIKIAENQNDMFKYLKRKRFTGLCKNELHKLKGLV